MHNDSPILPFVARVEVFDDGQWVPEAQGSSVAWLREARDEATLTYHRVRVVAWWGDEISLDSKPCAWDRVDCRDTRPERI